MQVYLISLCCPETSKSNFCFSEVSNTSFGGFLKIRVWFWMRWVFSCLFSHAAHFLKLELRKEPSPSPLHANSSLAHHLGVQKTLASPLSLLHPTPSPASWWLLLKLPSSTIAWLLYLLPAKPHSTIVACVSTQVVLKTKLTTICVFQNNASLYQAESLPFLSFV